MMFYQKWRGRVEELLRDHYWFILKKVFERELTFYFILKVKMKTMET